eukprot:GFUD01036019.1.p1 GENE.GFUD01036019.1~~GFUD01036019.1.p1  ORF type:complete len:145 (-),score=5.26 GFUD01036019.1:142-576(-)
MRANSSTLPPSRNWSRLSPSGKSWPCPTSTCSCPPGTCRTPRRTSPACGSSYIHSCWLALEKCLWLHVDWALITKVKIILVVIIINHWNRYSNYPELWSSDHTLSSDPKGLASFEELSLQVVVPGNLWLRVVGCLAAQRCIYEM